MRRHTATMLILLLAISGGLAASCFDPMFKEGIACSSGGECPPGQTCGDDGKCHEGGNNVAVDAPLADLDARPEGDGRPGTDARADGTPPPDGPPPECVNSSDCTAFADECNVGVCVAATGKCAKMAANEGSACGARRTCGQFGACGGFATVCDSMGTQSRSCTDFACHTGTCTGTASSDSRACTVSTEGNSCGSLTVTSCGACGSFDPANVCDETGTTSCTCTRPVCRTDVCTDEQSPCPR